MGVSDEPGDSPIFSELASDGGQGLRLALPQTPNLSSQDLCSREGVSGKDPASYGHFKGSVTKANQR